MKIKKWIKEEKIIWHQHFLPSLFAALIVAFISFVYEATISNIILFASVGASAIILTNSHSHHLTRLHTTIIAYIITVILSSLIYILKSFITLHMSMYLFLIIFLVGICLYLFNAFHPPAITASLSFILLERPLIDLLYLFLAIVFLLISVRFITYVFSQHLSVNDFLTEFKQSF